MGKILPSEIQRWVTTASENGHSAASVRKYHTMLHSACERAQRDQVVTFNPCVHTELPKLIKKKGPDPDARGVRRHPQHPSGAASVDGRDRHQHRTSVG